MSSKGRWQLPVGHVLVDVLLFFNLVVHSSEKFVSQPDDFGRTTVLQTALLVQEDAGVEFDLKTLPPPDEYLLIVSGNPAAGIVSAAVRPDGGVRSRGQLRDPLWFLLHEALSFPCWYLLGVWLERGWPRLGFVMIAYLALRAAVAVAGFYMIGWRIQVLFWLGLALYLFAFCSVRLCKAGIMTKAVSSRILGVAVVLVCPQLLRAQHSHPRVVEPACYGEWLEVSPEQFTAKWLTTYARRVAAREGHRTLVSLSIRIADKYTGPRGLPGTALGKTYEMWQKDYRQVLAWRERGARLLCITGSCRFSIRFADGTVKESIWGKPHPANLLSREAPTHILSANVHAHVLSGYHVEFLVRTSRELNGETALDIFQQIETSGIDEVFASIRNDSWFITHGPVFDYFGPPEPPPTREEYTRSQTMSCSRLPNRVTGCHSLSHFEGAPPPQSPAPQVLAPKEQ